MLRKRGDLLCEKNKISTLANISFLSNFKTDEIFSNVQIKVTCCFSLIINSVNIRRTKQRAVLEEVRSRSVTRCVPQTAAADLHALTAQLADVHQDNNLVSGNQQVLHAGSNHLMGGNQRTECDQRTDLRVFKRCHTKEFWRVSHLTQCFCHLLWPLYFILLLLEVTGEYIL